MAQPTPESVHVDGFSEKLAGRRKRVDEEELMNPALEDDMEKAVLDTAAREKLSDSDFALPGRRYPIHDPVHARNALARVAQHGNSEEQAKVRAAVKSRYPDIDVSKHEVGAVVDLWKAGGARQLVYGVVLTPGLRDSQGDIVKAEEIEQAAHRFVAEYRKSDTQHNQIPAGAKLVESAIAPHDMVFAGNPVLKGAWVTVWKIEDPELWARVSDPDHPQRLTGLSIGGTAFRVPELAGA
jgi:hypothetical protein